MCTCLHCYLLPAIFRIFVTDGHCGRDQSLHKRHYQRKPTKIVGQSNEVEMIKN